MTIIHLTPRRRKKKGTSGRFETDVREEVRGECVIIGKRNADQGGTQDENKECRFAQHLERIKHQQCFHVHRLTAGGRRCGWQEKAQYSEQYGGTRCQGENVRAGRPIQSTDDQSGDNPSDRSPHAECREFIAIINVGKRHRVAQPERRHVAEHVTDKQPDQR
jgi:hypothetical protein